MATQFFLYWEEKKLSLAEFFKTKEGLWKLQRGATCDLSQVKDESPLHEKALHQLEATLHSWGTQKTSLHCLLPANKVFLKTVRLEIPSGLEDTIPRLVALEAKYVFPSPLEELIWSFQIFPSVEREKVNVAYVATKKKFLEPLLEIISKTEISELTIPTISAASPIICEALQLIDQSKEAKLILETHASFTNVILMKPNEILSSYTLTPLQKGEAKGSRSSLEKISADLLQILEHAEAQKCIPENIFVSGTSTDKDQLLSFLQGTLKIPTHDLDTLLKDKISVAPTASEF